jgi:RNA polymerase sigma-70 factor, ECF subfamily
LNEAPQPLEFYEALLGQMQPKLLAYILSLVANVADAKDVLQESNRIAYFQSLSLLKQRKSDRLSFGESVLENIAELSEEAGETCERSLSRLERCLARLQDKSRLVVSDFYYASLSIKQIAQKRSLQANHVTQILYRSRRALHDCITQLEKNEHE